MRCAPRYTPARRLPQRTAWAHLVTCFLLARSQFNIRFKDGVTRRVFCDLLTAGGGWTYVARGSAPECGLADEPFGNSAQHPNPYITGGSGNGIPTAFSLGTDVINSMRIEGSPTGTSGTSSWNGGNWQYLEYYVALGGEAVGDIINPNRLSYGGGGTGNWPASNWYQRPWGTQNADKRCFRLYVGFDTNPPFIPLFGPLVRKGTWTRRANRCCA